MDYDLLDLKSDLWSYKSLCLLRRYPAPLARGGLEWQTPLVYSILLQDLTHYSSEQGTASKLSVKDSGSALFELVYAESVNMPLQVNPHYGHHMLSL